MVDIYDNLTRRLSNITTLNGNSQLPAIAYTYDLVGNVTQVASTCPWLPNQSFTENFNYDSADQLTTAQENQNNGYQLTVNYGHWGKVNNYDLAQTDFINNTSTGDSRLFTYPSDPNNLQVAQTMFAPEQCNGTADILFSFGINGSLRKRETTQPQQHTEYYLFNSQGNLKAYSDDIMDFAYYGYNAANTRTYKLSLYNTNLWINGQQQPLNMQLQNAMFYPNTYLNFNSNGEYTKHYYNGTERIASRLGDNTTTIALNNNILEARKLQLEEQFRVDIHKLIYETVPIDMPPFMDVNALQPTGTPNDIYYYHPNHLGSTAFVTDNNATITQGFLYAPFGEVTTEYNVNFGSSVIPKYSFNAKELDEEIGMYYYEARYYKPPVFTSRDPLFEKYFWMSPYAYCTNNPVKYVDPSGEAPISAIMEGVGAFVISAGVSFFSNWLLDGQDFKTALNNVAWKTATADAITTTAMSLLVSGMGITKTTTKILNSKVGKLALETMKSMLMNISSQLETGKDFSDIDLKEEFFIATFSTLVVKGMNKKADELLTSLKENDNKVYNKCIKLQRDMNEGKNDVRIQRDENQVRIAKQNSKNANVKYAKYQVKNNATCSGTQIVSKGALNISKNFLSNKNEE